MPLVTNMTGEDRLLRAVGMDRTHVESGATVEIPQDVYDDHGGDTTWAAAGWPRADIDAPPDEDVKAPASSRKKG